MLNFLLECSRWQNQLKKRWRKSAATISRKLGYKQLEMGHWHLVWTLLLTKRLLVFRSQPLFVCLNLGSDDSHMFQIYISTRRLVINLLDVSKHQKARPRKWKKMTPRHFFINCACNGILFIVTDFSIDHVK